MTVLDPGDENLQTAPVTGAGAQVTGNLIGVEGDGATPVQQTAVYGVDLFADDTGVTSSANTVAGHDGIEVDVEGGSNDIIGGNNIGESNTGHLVSDLATAGLQATGVSNIVIGGSAGNDIGDIHGPGITLTDVTGAAVTNNEIGLASDGHTALPDAQGVVLAGTDTGTQIGPGNVISGNTGAGVDDSAPGLTITGNSIGTTPSGAAAVSNGSGVVLEATATNTTVSSNLLGGDPAAGQYQITQNGSVVQSKVEAGVIDEAPGAKITGNRIGINAQGTAAVANTDGVAVGGGGSGIIRGNVIADNTVAGIYAGSSGPTVIRSNPVYGNGTGIGGGAPAAPRLTAADRVVSGGVTRTWLAVTGLPSTPGTIEAFGNASCADPEGRYPLKLQTTTPGSPNQIVTILGNTSLQGFTVTFTPAGGSTTAFSSCATADTSATDSNGDGIPDDIESLSPYGPASAFSSTFAAVPTDNGGWIGLNLQAGSGSFTNVAPVADPGTEPGGVSFPDGLIAFTLTGIKPGSSVVVDEIYSPTTSIPATYWKYGPTVAGASQRYVWNYDASTKIGAVPTRFNVGGTFYAGFALLLTDGAPGDDDLTANGTIYDPGGPAVGPGASTARGYRMAGADGESSASVTMPSPAR